ncbi:hypothetical protein AKJ50_00040 [candidate division MSBL1 archaeon SCGC-AAA382A13]|uniref:Uncharacterized protein n=1 Tax=candidate division MSBL1 archaeon SCGC-AAA382A13 TaxID=1698279 RepID=A0A133VH09_9EURY|nr:hypothetical protein AKJ50_00040 [candidate division MSBL1 archaeon SCGC-AAA382A13]
MNSKILNIRGKNMEPEIREERVTEIMSEMVNTLDEEGALSLATMSEPYIANDETGLCLMAFSRLEAEGLIIQQLDGKWKLSERRITL